MFLSMPSAIIVVPPYSGPPEYSYTVVPDTSGRFLRAGCPVRVLEVPRAGIKHSTLALGGYEYEYEYNIEIMVIGT